MNVLQRRTIVSLSLRLEKLGSSLRCSQLSLEHLLKDKRISYLWNYFSLFVGWLLPWHRCPVVSVTNPLLMLELWLRAVISIRLTVVILLESLSWEYHPWSPCHQELPVKRHPEQQSWPSRPWSKPFLRIEASWWTWSCGGKSKRELWLVDLKLVIRVELLRPLFLKTHCC